jgi:hypothetical protein
MKKNRRGRRVLCATRQLQDEQRLALLGGLELFLGGLSFFEEDDIHDDVQTTY